MIKDDFKKIKDTVFRKKGTTDKNRALITSLVKTMHYVGGYENLMHLPIPAWRVIDKGIYYIEEDEAKKMSAMMGNKKHGR